MIVLLTVNYRDEYCVPVGAVEVMLRESTPHNP